MNGLSEPVQFWLVNGVGVAAIRKLTYFYQLALLKIDKQMVERELEG